jgi:hypothetical protein
VRTPTAERLEREEQRRAELRASLRTLSVPENLHSGLIEYLVARRPTGAFLGACLRNDLKDAALRADDASAAALVAIVRFLVYHAPGTSWGNETLVSIWLSDPNPTPLAVD